MRRGAVLLAAAALLAACSSAPTPSPTAAPTPRAFEIPLAWDGQLPIRVTVYDATGLVTEVHQNAIGDIVPLGEADSRIAEAAGIVVRRLPGENGLLIDWGSGVCNTSQSILISRAGGILRVTLDQGRWSQPVCDLALLGWEIAVRTSEPVDLAQVTATSLPTAAP